MITPERIRVILDEVDTERTGRRAADRPTEGRRPIVGGFTHPRPSCGSSSHACVTDALRVIGGRRCDGCGRVFTP